MQDTSLLYFYDKLMNYLCHLNVIIIDDTNDR